MWTHRNVCDMGGAGDALLRLLTGSAVLLMLASPDVSGEEMGAPKGLRIASWDVSEAPNLMPAPEPVSDQTRWRTSFGSERRTQAPRPEPAALTIDADAVLLQGVTDARVLKRLFPAREWRLVVSRQMFQAPERRHPLTAIAVRAREGMRITAREHLLADDPADPEDAAGATGATAVRLAAMGRNLWLLSAALPGDCASAGAPCPPRQRIAEWEAGKTHAGDETVVGGTHVTVTVSLPSRPCSAQSIGMTRAGGSSAKAIGKSELHEGKGCIAVIEAPTG